MASTSARSARTVPTARTATSRSQARRRPDAAQPPRRRQADQQAAPSGRPQRLRLLITAGPTHEPIDSVRYIGNRSSGQVGLQLAKAALRRGHLVTLLMGPTSLRLPDSRCQTLRFRTTADLAELLAEHFPRCDVLVMAAAVADYRPTPGTGDADSGKLRRRAEGLTLRLEPTPDLLAQLSPRRRPGQTLVGFALEPADRLLESARSKLARKGLDLIVANELATMDAGTIDATLLDRRGQTTQTPGPIAKSAFGPWLIRGIEAFRAASE